MPLPLYSVQFIAQTFTGVGASSYPVPAGHVIVVRDIDIVAENDFTNGGYNVTVKLTGVGIFSQDLPPGWHGTVSWRGRQVSQPSPDTLQVFVDSFEAVPVDVAISGYLLTTP